MSTLRELPELSLGVLLVGSWDFNFLGFYINSNRDAKSLTFWRGSEVSQVQLQSAGPMMLKGV